MKFGITLFPTVGSTDKAASEYFQECLRLADLAEELGLDHVKAVEHYFFEYGGFSPDPVTLLAAIAGRTRRVRLGTSAVIPAFTHPLKLAGELAMLDNISGGRLDIAFGRGFLPDEFAAFEVPLDESRDRFDEGMEACRRLLAEEDLTWSSEYHKFGPVTLLPRPVQQPHPPIFVTSARSEESCIATGAAGHHLQLVPGILGNETLQQRLESYRRAWADAGHEPGREQIHFSYPCTIAPDHDEAMALAGRDDDRNGQAIATAVAAWARTTSAAYPGYERLAGAVRPDLATKIAENKTLAGTPDDVRRQLETIQEWFTDDVTISLGLHSGHLDVEVAERTMRTLAEDIAPKLGGPA